MGLLNSPRYVSDFDLHVAFLHGDPYLAEHGCPRLVAFQLEGFEMGLWLPLYLDPRG